MEHIVSLPTQKLSTLTWISLALVILGAINWGLVGVFNLNLVTAVFGPTSPVSRVIYVVVGLAGLYTMFAAPQLRQRPSATRVG